MFDTDVVVTGFIGIVASFTSGWASWFFTRRKYNSEVDSATIHNMRESLDFYQSLSDDTKRRLDENIERSKKMEDEITELKKQVSSLLAIACGNTDCKSRKKPEQK